MSRSDVDTEYEKELDRYRSQRAVIRALMTVKDDVQKIDSDIAQSIHVNYLLHDLKMDREEVDSLFGTKHTSKSIEPIQKAKLMKYLTIEINAKCNDVNSFAHKIQQEEKFNVFQIENIRKQMKIQ